MINKFLHRKLKYDIIYCNRIIKVNDKERNKDVKN